MSNDSILSTDFLSFIRVKKFKTILADPPWQFQNRTGKVAPEHKRLQRYGTMTLSQIKALPVEQGAAETCHLYLWVPNALLPDGLAVMEAWALNIRRTLSGIRSGRTEDRTDGESVFTFATSPKYSS